MEDDRTLYLHGLFTSTARAQRSATISPQITCPCDQTEVVDGSCELLLPDYTGGAVVVEKYGLITGSAMPGWVDEDAVAAMVTLVLRATERQDKELQSLQRAQRYKYKVHC